MSARAFNVLFLCTGNSARSIMAETALRRWGGERFNSFSAGSMPVGRVNPAALALLASINLPTEGLRSKSWNEFAQPSGPRLDFVFTVCDNAAGEVCPIWPGQPMSAHWGVADPAAVCGSEREIRDAFTRALRELEARIKIFVSLPLGTLNRVRLQQRIEEIGRQSLDVMSKEESLT